eukprot:TRINITY_DN4781_c0_g1_i1.p1 TRINITY_DN4781_c0_g1~~TRINITY_DN4781_c0_g1_i1.p1  ORF type:complete len:564 (+),score=72.59 TRINITY_DN4781_c0_g1_i1:143-1834(+)
MTQSSPTIQRRASAPAFSEAGLSGKKRPLFSRWSSLSRKGGVNSRVGGCTFAASTPGSVKEVVSPQVRGRGRFARGDSSGISCCSGYAPASSATTSASATPPTKEPKLGILGHHWGNAGLVHNEVCKIERNLSEQRTRELSSRASSAQRPSYSILASRESSAAKLAQPDLTLTATIATVTAMAAASAASVAAAAATAAMTIKRPEGAALEALPERRPTRLCMIARDVEDSASVARAKVRPSRRPTLFNIMSDNEEEAHAIVNLESVENFLTQPSQNGQSRNLSMTYEALDHYWLCSSENNPPVVETLARQEKERRSRAARCIQVAMRRRFSRQTNTSGFEGISQQNLGHSSASHGESCKQPWRTQVSTEVSQGGDLPSSMYQSPRQATPLDTVKLPNTELLSRPLPLSVEKLREEGQAIREALATLKKHEFEMKKTLTHRCMTFDPSVQVGDSNDSISKRIRRKPSQQRGHISRRSRDRVALMRPHELGSAVNVEKVMTGASDDSGQPFVHSDSRFTSLQRATIDSGDDQHRHQRMADARKQALALVAEKMRRFSCPSVAEDG